VRGRPRIEPATLPLIGFAALLALTAALILYETRATTLWVDEWVWALERRGGGVNTLLEPHNGHFSLVPVVLYKLLFATAGLAHYAPYRVLVVVAHLLCAVLIFVYARPRLGAWSALIAAALILTLGPAWQNFLWPFQIGWLVSLAAALGAMLALDRADRRGDTLACVLIALALASSGLGIPVAAGLLLEVLWRRQWRDAWIALAPLALYAAWWLAYQDTELVRGNIVHAPGFAAGAAAGAVGALSGLSEIRVDAGGAVDDAGAALAWGRPLAVAAAFVLAWRLAALRPLSARIVGLLAMALTFWLLTGLQRAHVGSPDASRYLYVGAFFVVLIAVELARGLSLGGAPAVVVACAAGLVIVSNLGDLRIGARYLRSQAPVARADLGALELARTQVPAGYIATSFPGTPFIFIRADRYFAAAAAAGTPAFSPADIAGAPEPARRTADAELVSIHRVVLRPGRGGAGADAAPAVEASTGGDAGARGGCVRFRPAAAGPAEPAAKLELTLPPGGIVLTATGGSATVSVRRFAATYPEQPLGRLAASGSGVLRIDADRAPQPWHVRVAPEAGVAACGLP
jgi:hypothetical protein